ncbi:hypothetical protein BG842_12075 [Haladaptatus sp. W1]|uniref:AlbA family DNA-binding domain-containing protein n=1 Tax=Haladaptatus sp. W1 TaxID=1897478 RepID=UPI000849BBA9|nr:RNA-binding domain-containing protein [Haladaptatus sp. W1]ODR80091.1 hypothetical protein BG842_12075 [Haladaptatus sp. W1]
MSFEKHWTKELYQLLQDPDAEDSKIVEFIENSIPNEEGRLIDNKRKMFLGADSPDKEKERQVKFIKPINAFANVVQKQPYRFLFVGFNDDRTFMGISDWGADGGQTLYDVDESKIQNLIEGSLEPTPNVERYKIHDDGRDGVIFVIMSADIPPVLTSKSINEQSGKSILEVGVAYTRKGSTNRKMRHSDYRVLIERREELINEKFESVAQDLNQVVGIPSDQLEEMDLSVSASNEGVPVREVLSTDATEDIDDQLTIAAKNWNSTGELISDRRTLYRFYKRRSDLELTDTKLECLIRSFLSAYLAGYHWINEWLMKNQTIDPVLERCIEQDINGNNIRSVERVIFMMDKDGLLQDLDDMYDFSSSEADDFIQRCGDDPQSKVDHCITRSTAEVGNVTYTLSEIIENNEDGEAALESLIDELLQSDDSLARSKLRAIELALLSRQSGITP